MAKGEIVIKIVSETSGTSTGETPKPSDPVPQEISRKTDNVLENAIFTSFLQREAKQVKAVTVDLAKQQANLYFSLTDNYLAQQELDIASSIIDKGVGIGMSIAAGAIAAGPVGAIIGGVVGLIKLGDDIRKNYQEQQIKLKQMGAQLSFNRERAGYSLTAGSRGMNR